ncbi:MAG TPA: 2-oxo acid dehydrogenase subunit E2 [Pirellulales bacterium]|nr:2-oxo acid dehydrogenase subunit E2 [Pirellulales bacterium]
MAVDFKLPNLGENIDAGDVVNVLVKEGDEIKANDPVVEVETGKATVEIPCPHGGKVTKVHVQVGQSVPVGGTLVTVEASSGAATAAPAAKPAAPAAAPAKAPEPAAAKPAAEPPSKPAPAPAAPVQRSSSNGGAPKAAPPKESEPEPVGAAAAAAGPSTRRLARELGVDINRVRGTGTGGRITREDVVATVRNSAGSSSAAITAEQQTHLPEGAESSDKWGTVVRSALSRVRKTIAANMVASSTSIPHVTNFDEADITDLERIRKQSQADYADSDVKLTMMPFVMKAVAQALRQKEHALMNASLDTERDEIVYHGYVNLGVAVDTKRGLVVPVVRNVDRMSIPQLAQALSEVATKARDFKFAPDDQIGGTFTISNMGAVGGIYSTPIINPPQVAILLLGRSRKLPVVIDDRIEPRLMMPLSLSYDHRLIDGATAARFLNDVKNYLQVPGRLLLAQ